MCLGAYATAQQTRSGDTEQKGSSSSTADAGIVLDLCCGSGIQVSASEKSNANNGAILACLTQMVVMHEGTA